MGAIGHYIEAQGVPTVGISLIREHTERIKPPRALWVPFELGRPLGAPNEPEFQLDVLRATLRLLERESGPVLEDYPHDAPESTGGEPWACPVALPSPDLGETDALSEALLTEVSLLRPWYDEALRSRGRSTVGLSGLGADDIDDVATFLAGFAAGESPAPPAGANEEMPVLLRFLSDDLKAFYLEAASAQPGRASPSPTELNDWLFGETTFGDLLYRLRDRLAASEDPGEKAVVGGIIPFLYAQRPER
ncbi:MAG: hypothetical protein IH959_01660 [Chloroflexi bacterium]|nr:hypothetical protein [Chloroflexota bacterium]